MLATLLILITATQAADTAPPAHDALHHDITLVPSDTGAHLLGEVETAWRLRSGDPVTALLDSAMRVVRVLVDGRPNTRLSRTMYGRSEVDVIVPHQKAAGDSITTRIRYHGSALDAARLGPNQYGDRTIAVESWPDRARFWFPAPHAALDRASAAFKVQAPLGQQVIANGVLLEVDTLPYAHATWHYRMDSPIPAALLAVGIGRFAVASTRRGQCAEDCVPVGVWSYPQDSAYAVTGPFRRAGEMVDWLSGLIGPFPYRGLSHVEAPVRSASPRGATTVLYSEERYRSRTLDERLVARATAHQWFGAAVTEADPRDRWLSDGLSSYLAALWQGHADGDSAFQASMREAGATVIGSRLAEQPVQAAGTDSLPADLGPRGAWVLHQLRAIVGDSAFLGGLRRFYQAFRDSSATSADFARIASQAAGQDLDWYFRQALTQPGHPVLDLRWRRDGRRLVLEVTQVQKPEWGTFRLPGLLVRIDGKPVRLDVEGRRFREVLEGFSGRPRMVELVARNPWLVEVRSKN
ncbi:MAG: M1 family aminopeptidase [Gemmatimonadales bacterium]